MTTGSLRCESCDKRLTRKTARRANGKRQCSRCLLPPLKGGIPEGMVPVSRGPTLGHSIKVRSK